MLRGRNGWLPVGAGVAEGVGEHGIIRPNLFILSVNIMKNLRQAGLVLGLSAASIGSSFALDCGVVASSPSLAEFHPECNAAASAQLITGPAINQMQAISNAVSLQTGVGLGGGPLQVAQGLRGVAAGANTAKWNVWASGNRNDTGFAQTNSTFNFGGIQNAVTIGGDYRLSPVSTVGISASYDDGSVRPENGGGLKVTNVGVNVAPYFAYQFNKNYSMDAALGVGWGSLKRAGGSALFIPDYDGDTQRRFAGVNLNSGHWYGNLQVSGKASAFYSHQHNDTAVGGLDEATKYLLQGRLGVQTAYWMGNGLMPYVGLTYVNDISRNTTPGLSLDKDGFIAGVGLNYFSKGGITGGISYTSEFGRHDVINNVFTANVNVRF